jgi:hypothetical protein
VLEIPRNETAQSGEVYAGSNNDNDNDNDDDNSNNDGDSESRRGLDEDLGNKLCSLLDRNRIAAAALAVMLGYPGLDQAAQT